MEITLEDIQNNPTEIKELLQYRKETMEAQAAIIKQLTGTVAAKAYIHPFDALELVEKGGADASDLKRFIITTLIPAVTKNIR